MSSGSCSMPVTPLLPSQPATTPASAARRSTREAIRVIDTCLFTMDAIMVMSASGLPVEAALVPGVVDLLIGRRRRVDFRPVRADGAGRVGTDREDCFLRAPVLPDEAPHVGMAAAGQEEPVRPLLHQQVEPGGRRGRVRQWA